MKFLPITVLVTLLITGCKQATPLDFISAYHASAQQCSQAIDAHNASDGSKSELKQHCDTFSQQAKSFEQALHSLTPNQAVTLESSASHTTMLSEIMAVGFKYAALNSPANEGVVVLSSPNVVRVVTSPQ